MSTYRPFIVFYALTFLLLALVPLFAVIFNDGSMDYSAAAEQASQATGIAWTSSLINVIRLSMVEPVLLLAMLGSAVPALAAVVTLFWQRTGWRSFVSRLLPWQNTPTRKVIVSYTTMFVVLSLSLLVIFWLRGALGYEYSMGVSLSISVIPLLLLMSLTDQGALLEELGWRGYMQPGLQEAGMNPLTAAIVVGLAWGLWHLPRDITTGVIESLGFWTYLLQFLPAFLLGTIAASVIAIFFCNQVGGSVIPAIIVHGLTNDAIGLSGTATVAEALTPLHQITKNLPLAIIAGGIIFLSGKDLSYRGS